MINKLTVSARNTELAKKHRLTRRHIDYVAKALLFAHSLTPAMSSKAIAEFFSEWTISRIAEFKLTPEEIDDFRIPPLPLPPPLIPRILKM